MNTTGHAISNRPAEASLFVAADALRASEARYRAILEATVDAIVTADESGEIESFNAGAEKIFGYTADEIIGRNVSVLISTPFSTQNNGRLHEGWPKIVGRDREVRGRRKDGTTFPLEISASEVVIGGERLFTAVMHDVSNRRRLEQEVLRISEEERQRIGRDLHDGIGSLLSGMALGIQGMAQRARTGRPVAPEELEEIARMIEEGASQAHTLSRGLNPVKLESEGLVSALRELAGGVCRLSDATCRFESNDDVPEITGMVAAQLFRIGQEALNNAVKHAHASEILIKLDLCGDHVSLSVIDDGIGLPDVTNDDGMGIHIMPYRARMIDGHFEIRSAPGKGTTVTCSVPVAMLSRLSQREYER